ncbi:MFS-type transporter SLC18B1-like isoform X2 [Gadus chalcogrammus]|uniref:MFS-type transporter SLC18B1-like isoform X2 n=1 Tax=Gadus chalcogrammus TaxID=1042646 RepID=UPI0024C37903|nr:MFS-type transporter SLC18B1-like isoform X2 [Gadus chalcogrammus]
MTEYITEDEPTRSSQGGMSRTQVFTLISVASVNFGSMICYSILAPFFPHEVSFGAALTNTVESQSTFIIVCIYMFHPYKYLEALNTLSNMAFKYQNRLTKITIEKIFELVGLSQASLRFRDPLNNHGSIQTQALQKGASQTVVGLIFGCYALSNFIGSLIMGRYIVQIGAKLMLVSGLFVSGGCTIMFGFLDRAPSGSVFISLCFIVRSVDAMGFAAAFTSSTALASKVFPHNVATILGSLQIFTGLGLILGPPLGGWLYQAAGYELPFLVLGCILLLMVPFNMIVMPSCDADPSEDSFIKLLRLPKVLLLCFFIFTFSSGLGFLDTTLSLFAMDKFHLSPSHVGLIFLAFSLPYCLSSPLLGFFADKYPDVRGWFLVSGGLLMALGFCFLGPAPFFHLPSQLWLTIFMLSVNGFGTGIGITPILPEVITSAYEQGFVNGLGTLGMVSGLFGACWSMGMLYGPMMGGLLTQHLTFEWAAFIQGGLSGLAATLLGFYYLTERLKKPSDAQENGITTPGEETTLLA